MPVRAGKLNRVLPATDQTRYPAQKRCRHVSGQKGVALVSEKPMATGASTPIFVKIIALVQLIE